MSADNRRGRGLRAEERALWRNVTRSVAPLRHRRSLPSETSIPAELPPPKPRPAVVTPGPMRPADPPPLAPMERRLRQRISRGRAPIDGRLDLHGLTQGEAHHALLRFLRRVQADGARVVLVVTGKGAAGARDFANERGVLRRQVPLWLRLPEFRVYVVGFEAASAGHGGEGALYVRLRKAARTRREI